MKAGVLFVVVIFCQPPVVDSELQAVLWNNTGFGGVAASTGTTSGGVSGPSNVGCYQSTEMIGTLTPPALKAGAFLSFAAKVDTDLSALRIWVADFLVLDANKASSWNHKAKLWYSIARKDATFCASEGCDETQKASGYAVLSPDEGYVPSPSHETTSLFFSWSATNLDNWITDKSTQPGPSYTDYGNPDGAVYSSAAAGRLELVTYTNADGTHHMAAATASMKAWALAHGFTAKGTLGWMGVSGSGSRIQLNASLALPASITSSGPLAVRIHHARTCDQPNSQSGHATSGPSAGSGWLSLLWNAGTSSSATKVIPANAFSPVLSSAQEEREAMRKRLYEPKVPWQTYVHSSMTAHTLQPTGLVLRIGIIDLANRQELGSSGKIVVWPRFVPAHTRPGRHSLNGSDFTSLEVSGWGKPAAKKNDPMLR
jgi:hypothetical protein